MHKCLGATNSVADVVLQGIAAEVSSMWLRILLCELGRPAVSIPLAKDAILRQVFEGYLISCHV